MGNSLLRELRCLGEDQRKNRKENQAVRRKRQEMAVVEGETQGQEKDGKGFLSTSNQEPENAGSEEVCYTVIRHPPQRRPSLGSSDHGYENVDSASRRAGSCRATPETEYALLRTCTPSRTSCTPSRTSCTPSRASCTPSHTSCTPEHDYELVLPR